MSFSEVPSAVDHASVTPSQRELCSAALPSKQPLDITVALLLPPMSVRLQKWDSEHAIIKLRVLIDTGLFSSE